MVARLTRQDVLARMPLLILHYPFRQEFGYSNQAYVVAGEIIPKVTGMSWEKYVENSLLKPLKMNRTRMLTAGIDKQSNVAFPYTTCCNAEGKLLKIPFDNLDNLAPATSMVSSASDMARWMIMQLDSGRLEGKQILPWSVLEKTRVPNTIVSTAKMVKFPLSYQFYCLGTGLVEYAGNQMFAHWGGASGSRSTLTLVPQDKLGILVMTNQDNSNFHEALRFQILDAYLNVPYTNRHQFYLNRSKIKDQNSRKELKALAQRVKQKSTPLAPITAFCGLYQNELYGTLSITADTAKSTSGLVLRLEHHPNIYATLDYMDGSEFRLSFSNPRLGVFPVAFDVVGNQVRSIEIKGTDFVDMDSYKFKKLEN